MEGESEKVKCKYVRKAATLIKESIQSSFKDAGTQIIPNQPESG